MEIVSCLASATRADRPEATNQRAPSVDRFRLRLNQLVHTVGMREMDSGIFMLAKRLVEVLSNSKTLNELCT